MNNLTGEQKAMIKHEGNEQYLIYLSSGEILELSEDELIELHSLTELYFFPPEDDEKLKVQRSYNKKEKIIMLFNQYKSKHKTKSGIFRQIAKELDISYKAVEKAYYTK